MSGVTERGWDGSTANRGTPRCESPENVERRHTRHNRIWTVCALQTLLKVNQVEGVDCSSCAWADPEAGHRKTADSCENGAKAVAWEATTQHADAAFFAANSVDALRAMDNHALEHFGRLAKPMYLAAGATHYRPISWDFAIGLAADRLRELQDPNCAIFLPADARAMRHHLSTSSSLAYW